MNRRTNYRGSGNLRSELLARRNQNSRYLVVVLIAVLVSLVARAATPSDRLPNIVVILADDLGWNDVSYHGSDIRTPNIDRIAREGVELNHFYAQPTCSPTRAALMTGKSPQRLGITTPISKNQETGLPLNEKILPQYLNDLGYRSLMVGKWHLGHHVPAQFPHRRGFEHFYGYVSGGIGYWDHNHGGGHDWQRDGVTLREEGYATRLLADEAVRLIEAHNTKIPLFLYVAMPAPHLPNEAPEDSIERYQHIQNSNRRAHAAMVSELDDAIGRIFTALKTRGQMDNTIVLFASDNGGLIEGGIPGPIASLASWAAAIWDRPIPIAGLEFFASATYDGGSDNTPLKLGKGSVSEGGVRVPAALWWPARLSPRKHDGMVTASDLLPTLLAATGSPLQSSATFDGASQWQALRGMGSSPRPDYMVSSFSSSAYYHWPWKLVNVKDPELYQVMKDPDESHDLSAEYPELVVKMAHAANNWPAGKSLGVSLFAALFDMDSFGGAENREPWAKAAQRNAAEHD